MRIVIDLNLDEPLVHALSTALDERDTNTMDHCKRVSKIACALGYHSGISEKEMVILYAAASLHDIGKIGIPDAILFKKDGLTDDEYSTIKTHPDRGSYIIGEIHSSLSRKVARIVRHHHEHFAGCGYPDGLSGEDIPFLSRILFLADCYDGILSARPYHANRTHDDVMRILHEESGIKSDPTLFRLFASKIGKPDFDNICLSVV